jgi:purine-cytosine permease-like protein
MIVLISNVPLIAIPFTREKDMLSTLLLVLFVLMLAHACRVSLASVHWSIDPARAMGMLLAILLVVAFTIGFIDL